jgi:hypothetical protein
VVVPPGEYRIDQRLDVTQNLYLLPGATLIRKQSSPSTEPVVLLTDEYATLAGSGWVMTENNSPRGVVCVGPREPNVPQNILWTRIDGIKIKGVTTDSDNVGLNLDSSEPTIGGANYNGSFSNLVIREVGTGLKVKPYLQWPHLRQSFLLCPHTLQLLVSQELGKYVLWRVHAPVAWGDRHQAGRLWV